ncbi:chaplin [Embleya sp. NPDC050154]|uniref:chaplin n=1 Tax=unclassified Embleya TaxID=2699296 RepID=UPI0037ACA85F
MNTFRKAAMAAAGTVALVLAGAGAASAGADADGAAVDSPGVLSGNNVQVPVHVPVNLCGNTVNIIAGGNFAFGNTCLNVDGDDDHGDLLAGHQGAGPAGTHR